MLPEISSYKSIRVFLLIFLPGKIKQKNIYRQTGPVHKMLRIAGFLPDVSR